MEQKDLNKLKNGDFIEHKHYGICLVHEIVLSQFGDWFGIVLKPLSFDGILKLFLHSRVAFNSVLETSKRLILSKVQSSLPPKLINKSEEGFEVLEWIVPGEVSPDGMLSLNYLKSFDTFEEAEAFAKA